MGGCGFRTRGASRGASAASGGSLEWAAHERPAGARAALLVRRRRGPRAIPVLSRSLARVSRHSKRAATAARAPSRVNSSSASYSRATAAWRIACFSCCSSTRASRSSLRSVPVRSDAYWLTNVFLPLFPTHAMIWVFMAAVGHFIGNDSVVERLRRYGLSVERVVCFRLSSAHRSCVISCLLTRFRGGDVQTSGARAEGVMPSAAPMSLDDWPLGFVEELLRAREMRRREQRFFRPQRQYVIELNSVSKFRVSCIRVLAGYEFVYVFSYIYKNFVFFVYVSCIILSIESCIFVYFRVFNILN